MSPAPEDRTQEQMCAVADPPSAVVPLTQSSSGAFLSGLGFGVVATISKAGMGVQRLAAAQWLKHRERKARAAAEEGAVMLRARESLSCGAKPQNCRRVVVLGAPRVGKSAILRRFLRDGFDDQYEPTREDFHRKVYHIRGETYQIDILDASGERDFPAKRRLSILTGDIFLLVFSMDDRSSFNEVRSLRSEIATAKAALTRSVGHTRVPVVICANKADLPEEQRTVSSAEAQHEFAEGCALFETSARDGTNLEEAFAALAEHGGLPPETGPSRHRKLSIRSYHALLRAARQRNGDAPCGALHPLARRPSFSTDLRLALSSRGDRKQKQTSQNCCIQ